jgi:hypothetical protein
LKPPTPPVALTCGISSAMSRPLSLKMLPVWSCAATIDGAGLGEQFGRRRADVAEALHRHACAVEVEVHAPRRFAPGDEHAAAGGLDAAQAAAQVDGLAGDHAGGGGCRCSCCRCPSSTP